MKIQFLFLFTISIVSFSQSVTIDPKSSSPSIINANTTNQAVQLPSLSSPGSIASPQTGQIMYNQTTASPNFYNGLSWQNLSTAGNSGLYANFPNSKHFVGLTGFYTSSATKYQSYNWTVPAGVTKIWVELWGSGVAGSAGSFPLTVSYTGFFGGKGGNYLSAICPVTPGSTISIYAANGSTLPSFYSAQSEINSGSLFARTGYALQDFSTSSDVMLLQYVEGQYYGMASYHTEEVSAGVFHRVIKAGKGGDSYPSQKGGDGSIFSVLLPARTFVSSTSSAGHSGGFPGGGGGSGPYDGGKGAGGMVIIHY